MTADRLRTALCMTIGLFGIGTVEPGATFAAEPAALADVLQNENFQNLEFSGYNNIPAAFAKARRTGKPLFATFRLTFTVLCKGEPKPIEFPLGE